MKQTKTYVIVVSPDETGQIFWEAYRDTFWLRLSNYNTYGVPREVFSYESADDCEQKLRVKIKSDRVGVRVVRRVLV